MTETLRKPAIFSVDDPRLVVAEPDKAQRPGVETLVEAPVENLPAATLPRKRRVPWGAMFWSALSGLVLLALGLAITSLIEDLFARAPWLGGVGLALALVAGLALLVVMLREIVGLVRLATVESLRERAQSVIASDDRERGRALMADMLALTRRIPRLARARARLDDHKADIIDGRDLVRLAERELMSPLDIEARRLVVSASKRVSVVTAISPRAAVDMVFVLVNALSLIRKLAVLYGGRPGALGVLKLLRQVMSHLAVTGGVSLTDSVVQQVIGHGIAARLSARLGEGMVNGLLTARLGILAIDLVRPLPFHELPRPALNDLAGTLLRAAKSKAGTGAPGRRNSPGSQ
ncbi:MAG: TIGR01620 family protein [Xanthobacteraceae bacterium]|nr:TIGR01620 family protein [Xanthobacteraceae bacterium]